MKSPYHDPTRKILVADLVGVNGHARVKAVLDVVNAFRAAVDCHTCQERHAPDEPHVSPWLPGARWEQVGEAIDRMVETLSSPRRSY